MKFEDANCEILCPKERAALQDLSSDLIPFLFRFGNVTKLRQSAMYIGLFAGTPLLGLAARTLIEVITLLQSM